MATEAQRKATAKYRRENTKTVSVRYYPSEMKEFQWIEAQEEGRSKYIKRLVREDMERNKSN